MKQLEMTPGMKWEDILKQMADQDVVVTHKGHAVALISEFDDDDLEWYARERDPDFLASIARARQQASKGDTISHEELKRELNLE